MVQLFEKDQDFDKLIENKTMLIDFYADWCGPCRMLAPVLETIDEFDVLKVNVDEFNELARRFGVMSIPTLVSIKDGKVYKIEPGYKTKKQILNMFE